MNRRDFVLGTAALVLAPDAFARRLGGTAAALVTADLESHVVAVGIPNGRTLKRIRTLPGPRAIEAVGNVAVVAHTEHGALSFIDAPSLRVRGELGGIAEPRYAVRSWDARHAFVTDSARGQLVVVDVLARRIVGRVELGGAPRHLSYEPSDRVVWVALGNTADRVAVVDVSSPARPRLVRTFRPPFLAHDVGFGPGRVWVTGGSSREVVVYDGRGESVRLRADAPPQHVTFAQGFAFVTSGDSGTLRVHDARSGRLLRTSRVPGGSFNVQHGHRWVLTPSLSLGTLCIADARGRLLRRIRVARSSHDACFVVTA